MIIKSAKFIKSSTTVEQCPLSQLPEMAFIGRSNVGKSSLINMLTNNKKLAKTSGTPGKTQTINHFAINDNWLLVDLPGYGYAKVSKSTRNTFEGFISSYLINRKNLVCVFVLIDSRLEPQKIDLEFMDWLVEKQLPFNIIFTKADKLKPNALEKSIEVYSDTLLQEWDELPGMFLSSATSKKGREDILNYIESIL